MLAVGYYIWQIQYGDRTALAKQFQKSITNQFSQVSGTSDVTVTEEQLAEVIRSHNPTLGNPQSPVTIIAFIDFECPFCQQSYETFNTVIDKYGSAVYVVFKHLPLTNIHPNAGPAALAATCAHSQGKFWEYYHKLFTLLQLSDEAYLGYAEHIGIDVPTFQRCYDQKDHAKDIQQDILDAASLGVRGTPTYFVGTKKIEGVISEELWDAFILEQLQQ